MESANDISGGVCIYFGVVVCWSVNEWKCFVYIGIGVRFVCDMSRANVLRFSDLKIKTLNPIC